MSQSLYTAMGGISAAQTALNVTSNNIANLNTTGFKSSSVNFSDVFYTSISSGTAATDTTGGINPEQVGLGVQVSSISKNFSSGTWVATGKTTDLMIQGEGFFTVQSPSGEVFYTRAGNFSFDSDGDLVTSIGDKVLGTDSVLSPSSSTTPVHIPQALVTDVSPNAGFWNSDITTLNHCKLTTGNFNLQANGFASISLHVDPVTNTTMGQLAADLQAQITAAAAAMPVGPARNAYSNINVVCNGTTNGTIQFQIDGVNATSLTFTNPAVGASNFLSQTGLPTAKLAANTYKSDILDFKVDITQVTSIEQAVSISSYSIGDDGSIEATYSNGDTMAVEVGTDGNTYQFKYTTAQGIVIQNANVNVDPNVAVPANFVIQLASITNPDGLIAKGSNLYSAGPNSGQIIYSIGSAMGLGGVASGGLEASNVDLSSEFSSMILAQRAVQANSRVFSTTSQVMDAIVQMGR